MNEFTSNPTWQMLEKTKSTVKRILNDIESSMEDVHFSIFKEVKECYHRIQDEHNKLVQLQLNLENKILTNQQN